MAKGILALKRTTPKPRGPRPARVASVRTHVEHIVAEEALTKLYGPEYTAIWKAAILRRDPDGDYKVTIRPCLGGHDVIVNRFHWKFEELDIDTGQGYALLGGRGPYQQLRISLTDWNALLENSGALNRMEAVE